jgi:hypothetical protein
MIHYPERVGKLRLASAIELKSILELETVVRNPQAQEQLNRIKSWLGDIEEFFLFHFLRDQMPAPIEVAWLNNAEMMLRIASNQFQEVNRLLAQYGANFESRSG